MFCPITKEECNEDCEWAMFNEELGTTCAVVVIALEEAKRNAD